MDWNLIAHLGIIFTGSGNSIIRYGFYKRDKDTYSLVMSILWFITAIMTCVMTYYRYAKV